MTTNTSFDQEFNGNIYEPWRFEYVAYDSINSHIQRRAASGWSNQDEAEFESTLRLEADKIDLFITRKQREIDSRIAYCERILVQQRPLLAQSTTNGLFDSMDDALTEILLELNDLGKFARYNFLAFKHLIDTHTKLTHIDRQQLLVEISRKKALDRQRFDVVLVKVSTLHDMCRQNGQERTGNAAAGGDQNAFERATAKYWVHPDNVTELKAILLFHLPVLVFDSTKPFEASDSAISSVYYDNPEFDLYSGRLQRDESAEAIRFRWYGPMSSKSIFIERKTHHAPWLDGASVKDRFRLSENKVNDYVSGRYTAEQYAAEQRAKGASEDSVQQNYFIASGVQKSFAEKKLDPVMRVFYNRTAFQIPGDQRLRISLDTDLTFIREDDIKRRNGNWRRMDVGIDHPFDYLPGDQVYRFPYAVLETKLQTHLGQEPPEWLTRLLDSKLVYEVPRFSKFLEGCAHFWNSRLPLLPWWLDQLTLDIRNAKQPKGDFTGLSRSKSLKPLIDGHYRMGYLEKQLEKRATLKRKESKTENPTRSASIRSVKGREKLIATPAQIEHQQRAQGNAQSTPQSYVIDVGATESQDRSMNPFADPFWNSDTSAQLGFDGLSRKSLGSPVVPNTTNNVGGLGVGGVVRNRTGPGEQRVSTFDGSFDTASVDPYYGKNTPRSSYAATPAESMMNDSRARLTGGMDYTIEEAMDEEERKARKAAKKAAKKEKKERKAAEEEEDELNGFGGMEKDEKKKAKRDLELATRLEPKVFFANERTFISWLQFAAILLTAALTLINFGDNISVTSGAVFFGISFVIAFYAFGRYRYRAFQITTRPHLRYDDLYGPIGLTILLTGALLLNFILRYTHPETTGTYLGLPNTTAV
ncbi:VTC domain-containing protein [Phycomyces blakesleeanus]|uniref:VTC domain-containing protein n=1 Tax=Phycomyces blakesleeanus TaxID=4837 RepID=A0ABR3AVJ0_PHYBL